MVHLLHDLVLEEGGELRGPLGSTGWAHPSSLAGERDQELLGTPPAANPGEAALPETAREVALDDLVHETPPEAVAALEALLPRALDPLVERLEKAIEWPPDPFNETGRFEVVERTATLLKLKGVTSPVTGLAFEHEYEITGDRTVRMKTTATNGRATPVSWDLWPNTRVRTEGFPYVKLDPAQMLRMDGPRPDDPDVGAYPSEVRGGWLTLAPGRKPDSGRKKLWAKAYVRPSTGLIAYFLGRQMLVIRAPLVPRQKLHGEQAFVEIYRGAGKGADKVLELEMHGPYETLAPGASTSFEQTFELLDYEGPETPEGHLARLRELG